MLVRYRTKPGAAAENRRLIEAMFEALQAQAPEDLRYMVFEYGDGSFIHLKTDLAEGEFELDKLPAVQAFRHGIRERCEEPPQPAEARLVGSYGLAVDG
jgi:hypothetical protein